MRKTAVLLLALILFATPMPVYADDGDDTAIRVYLPQIRKPTTGAVVMNCLPDQIAFARWFAFDPGWLHTSWIYVEVETGKYHIEPDDRVLPRRGFVSGTQDPYPEYYLYAISWIFSGSITLLEAQCVSMEGE